MTMRRVRQASPGVLYCEDAVPTLDANDLAGLPGLAAQSPRGRARICTHRAPGDALHEMFIAVPPGGYVRPHRHLTRAESFHVLSGRATILLFEEDGRPRAAFEVGDLASGRPFYYRLDAPVFHALLVEEGPFLFHETTTGPFDPATTQAAPWAPEESDPGAGCDFLQAALRRIAGGAPT
jgi:cupin fold WbuC family metalloprotein